MLWDVHGPWEHQGLQKHCKLYNMGTSLLHSEFGVEGMTNCNTLEKSVSRDHMLPASRENEVYFHRGSWWTNEPLLQEVFGGLETIDKIRTASQYMQFGGLKYAVECNRRRAFQNSGTFPWQFNEPYSNNYCTCSLDYYANPKPVYYGVSNCYSSILVSASFESPSVFNDNLFSCQVYVSTCLLAEEIKGLGNINLQCEVVGTDGAIYYSKVELCTMPENRTINMSEIALNKDEIDTSLFILKLKLINKVGDCIAENEYVFTKEKDLRGVFQLPKPELQYAQIENSLIIHNKGETAALFLFLWSGEPLPQRDFLYFNKNYFCIMPQEHKEIIILSDSGSVKGKTICVESFLYKENIKLD